MIVSKKAVWVRGLRMVLISRSLVEKELQKRNKDRKVTGNERKKRVRMRGRQLSAGTLDHSSKKSELNP